MELLSKVDFTKDVTPTHAVNIYMRQYPAPYKGLILDCETKPDQFGIFHIYTYKDNTHSFSDRQREELWIWLKDLLAWLNSVSDRHAFATMELESSP